jgi:hypothetical protein
MPYIKQDHRKNLESALSNLSHAISETAGNDISVLPGLLNYTITCLVKRCYAAFKAKMSYADHNAVVGMLDCAKMEFYRRATAPYEDEKVIENGDV